MNLFVSFVTSSRGVVTHRWTVVAMPADAIVDGELTEEALTRMQTYIAGQVGEPVSLVCWRPMAVPA